MTKWHYALGGFGLIALIIQFIPVDLPPADQDRSGDMLGTGLANEEIAQLLKTSCYNCHSNETVYPWYSHVAPSSWLVAKDVRDGRDELNFSTWLQYDTSRMIRKLDDIATEVGEGHMPKGIYTLVHPSARLSAGQRDLIVAWTESAMDLLVGEEEEDDDDDDDEEDDEDEDEDEDEVEDEEEDGDTE